MEPANALLALIARRSGQRELRYRHEPERLHGGYWAEIFAFELEDAPPGFAGDLVLRLMPDEKRARRESAVHATVAALGFPTPGVRASGDAAEELGRAFIVMDRVAGGTLASGLSIGTRIATLPRVPALLADSLVRLHALPAEAVRAELTSRGVPPESIGVDAMLEELGSGVGALRSSDLSRALESLHKARLRESDAVLCHGDMHPYNLILRDGRVAAVIDWTNGRLAEREFDAAYSALLLEQMPVSVPAPLRPLVTRAGRRASRRLIAGYGERRELDPDKLAWYGALHALAGLVRVGLSRSGIPGNVPLADSHPWVRMAQANAERLFEYAAQGGRPK